MSAPTKATLIDCVDANDHTVGTIRRGEALSAGANFRTAHVFVFDGERRLLLQRLAPTRTRHPRRWGSSVAAYLYAGETYEAAADRRLHEELGLRGRLEPLGKIQMHDGHSLKFVALFGYSDGHAVNREPDHIAELRYWTLDDVAERLVTTPSDFTPTFQELFRFYRLMSGA